MFTERNGQPYQHEYVCGACRRPIRAYNQSQAAGVFLGKVPTLVCQECQSHVDVARNADAQTIHIDDLSRNFALNPGEGLRVSGDPPRFASELTLQDQSVQYRWYRHWVAGPRARQTGRLCEFGLGGVRADDKLWNLATMPEGDFTKVDHGQWRKSPLRRQAIVPDATPVLPETDP